jgi:hypothetical protein
MRVQQFADEGARHDHTLIDIERQPAHVDLVDEVGRGLSCRDAARDHIENPGGFRGGDPRGRKRLELIGIKMQRGAHQEGGLGHRIGGAVREYQFRLDEPAHSIADEIEQRL